MVQHGPNTSFGRIGCVTDLQLMPEKPSCTHEMRRAFVEDSTERQRGMPAASLQLPHARAQDPSGTGSFMITLISYLRNCLPSSDSAGRVQGEQSGNRIMRFISSFLQYRDLDRESDCDTFAEKLLRLLIDLVTARDKSVRTRCCQLVQLIFNHLTADELDSDLLDTMQEAMLLRLEDKVPAVRAQAVQALRRLCEPGDESPSAYGKTVYCDIACHDASSPCACVTHPSSRAPKAVLHNSSLINRLCAISSVHS